MEKDTICAFPDCNCEVTKDKAFKKDNKLYCNEKCATGENCGHKGCDCHDA